MLRRIIGSSSTVPKIVLRRRDRWEGREAMRCLSFKIFEYFTVCMVVA